jgi:two-component system sensor histidine kinase KdpD
MLLPKVVKETVSNFQRGVQGRDVSLAVEEPVPIAVGEPTLVTHVLLNLLSNAVKYSPPGTPVQVLVGRSDQDEPQVKVVDEGMGFSAEDEAQLFTPFYRSKAATLKAGGMGLGLAVCRRILEVQDGKIEARSRPEGGAEFTFTLPPA